MNKKGQALIEAVAAMGLSVLFFSSSLGLWVTAVNDFKAEQSSRQKQLCELTGNRNCKTNFHNEGGFVLITMLLQLTVLVFAAQVLIALFLSEEYRWKISSWCFESGISAVSGAAPSTVDALDAIESDSNEAGHGLIGFQHRVQGPIDSAELSTGVSESFYVINWVQNTNFNFFKPAETTELFKCGAKKICHDEKCIYSLIADRS